MTDLNQIAEPCLDHIRNRTGTVRSDLAMCNRELAEPYQLETRYRNRIVKRNIVRFPNDTFFQLSKIELTSLRSRNVMSKSDNRSLRNVPISISEQGVDLLASVLN